MKIKKILFVSVSRADFYLQKILINKIIKKTNLKISLIITGNHFFEKFGYTYKDIYKEKYKFLHTIKVINEIKTDNSSIFSFLCKEFNKKIKKINPDTLILFGDRYEMLSAAIASMFLNIPIIHLHGGESTEGSIDDNIRHAITKMSHFHFVASDKYKKNVIQLGENPKNIFNTGSLSAERIKVMKKMSNKEIAELIGFDLTNNYFLVCVHPVTIYHKETRILIDALIKSLNSFKEYKIIFTYPSFDQEHRYIIKKINNYQKNNNNRICIKKNLGNDLYLNILKNSKAIIGNSSSGILDAPYLKVPTINLGNRQNGRLMANSIVNCSLKERDILKSIKFILSNKTLESMFASLLETCNLKGYHLDTFDADVHLNNIVMNEDEDGLLLIDADLNVKNDMNVFDWCFR